MQTLFLAIDLLPDFAIMAAIVIVAHWVWLFGLKNKFKSAVAPASSKKIDTDLAAGSKQFTGVQNESLISSSVVTDLYTSTPPEDLPAVEQVQAPEVETPPPSRETILLDKYADVDMVSTLEALNCGSLTPERQNELQELAFLTLSTEEKYPNPIDLELKNPPHRRST